MSDSEKVYDSSPPSISDQFWLDQGQNLVTDSKRAVETLANSLMSILGVILGFIQGIYLAIIGFTKIVPSALPFLQKTLFLIPVLFWLMSLYSCIRAILIVRLSVFLESPTDIRNTITSLLLDRQKSIMWAFWFMSLGMITSIMLIIFFSRYK